MIYLRKNILSIVLLFFLVDFSIAQEAALVKDINPEGNALLSNSSKYYAAVGENLFFVANDGTHGSELWITDGTEQGTRMVRDILPGSEGSNIHGLIENNGLCYFFADDQISGKELWSSDGTESGTIRITDINPGESSATFSSFEYLTALNGSLYFEAFDGSSDELWIVDSGNNANLFNGLPNENFHSGITGITTMDGVLYFFRKLTFDGLILYKLDGNQLTKISELNLGNIITHTSISNGVLYYAVQEGFDDILYAYNSNTDENKILANAGASINSMIAFDSKLIYSVSNDASLYAIDNISGNPVKTTIANSDFAFADEPNYFTLYNDKVYYYGETSNDGIHSTDGTIAGTELVVEMDIEGIHKITDKLLISGEITFASGVELFTYDGESLKLIQDINPGFNDSDPGGFVSVGDNKVYFAATTENEGRELWSYDFGPVSTTSLNAELVQIHPTLVFDFLSVTNKSDYRSEDIHVTIYNSQGSIIKTGKLHTMTSLDVNDWPSGFLYISIAVEDKIETVKVCKM